MTPVSKKKSRTQLLGYTPLEKRLASLQMSGIRTMVARDEHYDYIAQMNASGVEDLSGLPDIPPMPRHMAVDMADVSEYYKIFQARRELLEEKVRVLKIQNYERDKKAEEDRKQELARLVREYTAPQLSAEV